jgi:ATP-dependent Clp protease ATP-binding subunit ClpA
MSEIDNIVSKTIALAKTYRHEYVTVEHLATVVLDDVNVRALCYEIKADCVGIQEAILTYLVEDCKELIMPDETMDYNPRKTQMLERVFNRALTQALFQGKNSIDQVDLVTSILMEEQSAAALFSYQMGLTSNAIKDWAMVNASQKGMLTKQELEEMNEYGPTQKSPYTQTITSGDQTQPRTRAQMSKIQAAWDVLEQFTTNMNHKSGEYDDVIGRREELRDLVQTLARKKKSNGVLVGPSGVGKTAIVEGLAKLVVEGNVPETMKDKTVLSLEMSKLVAGTKYRGDFEERMKQLVEALEIVDDIILFVDEIHQVVGAGSTGSGQMDAGNMLKPALTTGKLKVIGATTDEEYRKIFEKESALARRFTKISVEEPTVEEAKEILRNTVIGYELHYGFEITGEACDLAVELSNNYIFNKKLPDKAFDIIDRACAYNKIMPEDEVVYTITDVQIREEVSRLTGIPAEHLGAKEDRESVTKHEKVDEYLRNTVFGQDNAIDRIVDSITVSLAGLKDPNKPIASYLFTGPTGVGKTELAKRLSQSMGMKLIRYDMGEYQERHSVAKLIGSPPGYVGHGDGKAGDGLLVTNIEDTPNSIILFDEVEKAHPDIMTVLLALLDDGVITGSTGKKVSAKNTIVIMTSNLGAREGETKSIGFSESTFNHGAVDAAINNFFAPEFRNRLDGIIRFNALKPENMRRIVEKFLHQLEGYVSGRHINLEFSNELKDFLERDGFDAKMGARPLARLINERVKLPLAKHMIDNPNSKNIIIDYHINNESVFITDKSAMIEDEN